MGLLSKIFSNTRKPEGFFGKMMVNGMNGGGGANIARLLQRAPKGVVQGIDYSSVSVAKSSKVNAYGGRISTLRNSERPASVGFR